MVDSGWTPISGCDLYCSMTERHHAQLTLAAIVLYGIAVKSPDELMDPELRRVDAVLDDPVLVDVVFAAMQKRWPQSAKRGRRGTPAEVTLRMLVLRRFRDWTFERLEWEVTGNIAYRRFCRIDGQKVPDAKTMIRLEHLLSGETLDRVFRRVTDIAVERKVTTGRKMRVDTTVVEAPIHYPTDSSLCSDMVRVLRRNFERIVAAGVQLPFKLRRVGRAVSRRAREIGEALRLRGDAAREAIKKPYRGLLRITGRLLRQAHVAVQTIDAGIKKMRGTRRRVALRARAALAQMVPRGKQVVRQARLRVFRGVTDSAGKLISVFVPDAQILRRGKLHRPTEFGVMAKVQESDGGIITDIRVVPEKVDMPLLVPSVEKHIEVFGKAPTLVATDRGFHSTVGEQRIKELGVKRAVIPKPGYRSKERKLLEKKRWFRRGRAWRAGGEARISQLKRRFGMARTPNRTANGTQRTVVWAGIANNLAVMAR